MKKANRVITILIFVFLYAPMLVLIIGSFNEGKSLARFLVVTAYDKFINGLAESCKMLFAHVACSYNCGGKIIFHFTLPRTWPSFLRTIPHKARSLP